MDPKQRAAEAALQFVRSGMVVGLGTGSTVEYFLSALSHALREGRLQKIQGIPTSKQSERRAQELGIPLTTLGQHTPDVTVDGADEIDPDLNLIKGAGGALLREKIVAQNSKQLIIIADESKQVQTLGTRSPLPVEVTPFGHETHESFLRKLGCEPMLRRGKDNQPFLTDNGNYIYNCRFRAIEQPATLETFLHSRAGIVESGLFFGIAHVALIGSDEGVEERMAPSRPGPKPI